MFLLSGIHKYIDYNATVRGFMGKTGLNIGISSLAIVSAMFLQIISPLIIIYESHINTGEYRKYAKWACYSLAIFTLMATLIYHFPPFGKTYYPFISNVTTFGALLLLSENFS